MTWGIRDPHDGLWPEAFRYRRIAVTHAVYYSLTVSEYTRLKTDTARWRLAYRRGYRIVRVRVTEVR